MLGNQDAAPTFDLLGHDMSENMFLDAYNSHRLHHAWLITGPRGIGKASLANRIARFLLHHAPAEDLGPGLFGEVLEKAPVTSLNTDRESRINSTISAGSHGDLVIIQRRPDEKTGKVKAEIAVDDVRKLQNFFGKTAVEGGWRVVIIDSADEMNRNAANALLKSLEEPPKNALLLLIAHAPGQLLPTLTSRCRQLKLTPLSPEKVCDILFQNFPDMTKDDIAGYATLSDGSPGYAMSLVENNGLELYIQILEILASMPRLDVPLAHKMADDLASKKNEKRYMLMGELLTTFINRLIRHVAAINKGTISPVNPVLTGELDLMEELGGRLSLDQWADLWEKIIHKMGRINLDRKQVILNVLTVISQRLT